MGKEDWRRQALEITSQVLSGQLDVLDGARRLAFYKFRFALSDSMVPDDDFNLFDTVADEIEELPFGSEKQFWNPAVLVEKEKEIVELRNFYNVPVLLSCQRLAKRLAEKQE